MEPDQGAPSIAQERLERAINRSRFVGAALLLVLGPRVPNLGLVWIGALAAVIVVYGLAVRRTSAGIRTSDGQRRLAQIALAGDAAVVLAAMLIFTPDARWTTFVLGALVVITGAFRFGSRGALLTAGGLATAYVAMEVYRERAFGYPFVFDQASFHVAVYFLTALLMAGIVRELREARAAETEARAALERHVAELDTANARLAEQTALAQAASEAKSRFLAGASHQLRTPLNAVLGFTGLLSEQLAEVLTERQRRYLRNIEEAGTRLLGLVDDVLAYARLDGDLPSGTHDPIEIGSLTAPVVEEARSDAARRGVVIDVVVAPGRIRLDGTATRAIVARLLANAVQATPSGGTVALDARLDGGSLVVEVADQGPPITSAGRGQIFDPFAETRGEGVDTGSGLGLALADRLVRQHGGSLDVESGNGGATTFRLRLPAR